MTTADSYCKTQRRYRQNMLIPCLTTIASCPIASDWRRDAFSMPHLSRDFLSSPTSQRNIPSVAHCKLRVSENTALIALLNSQAFGGGAMPATARVWSFVESSLVGGMSSSVLSRTEKNRRALTHWNAHKFGLLYIAFRCNSYSWLVSLQYASN